MREDVRYRYSDAVHLHVQFRPLLVFSLSTQSVFFRRRTELVSLKFRVRHQLVNLVSLQTFKSPLLSVSLDVEVVVYTTRPVGKYG